MSDVRKVLEVAMGEWISVDERLPEPNGSYLVYVQNPDDNRRGTISRKKYMPAQRGWTMKRDERGMGLKVTHWMPLPEPPTGG